MKFCTVPSTHDGDAPHRVHYETYGHGPNKVIFNMGLGGTMCQWEYQIDYFGKQRADLFEIVIYENRGMSLSEPVSGRWTTAKMARDGLFLLDHLGWSSQVHCVGLSMGGMIAQEICRQAKGRFASLTLISTIAGGVFSLAYFLVSIPTGVQLVFRANLAQSGRDKLKHGMKVMYPDSFLEQTVPHPEKTGETTTNFHLFRKSLIMRAVGEKEKGIPPPPLASVIKQGFAVMTHNVPMQDLAEISKSLNGNALVITGDEDILVHAANSARLSQGLVGSRLLTLPGAGHGAFEQCSQKVNQEIERLMLNAISNGNQKSGNYAKL